MRIVVYGEDWIGTLPQLLTSDLRLRGHTVEHFDFTAIMPGIRSRSIFERIKRRGLFRLYVAQIRSKFSNCVNEFKPEIVIISKGLHLDRRTIETIKCSGAFVVNWNPDDFFNMKNSSADLIAAIPEYDLIVSAREHLFPRYTDVGAKSTLFLDWYYVPELHYPRNLPLSYNVTFVGSWSPFREEFISKVDSPVSIWGGGWEKSSVVFRKKHDYRNAVLSQKEMSAVFNQSRFNLNLLTRENSDYTNLRLFEVTASGGLLMTERNSHASSLFNESEDVLMFNSPQDFNYAIKSSIDFDKVALSGNLKITGGKNKFSDRVDSLLYAATSI